MNDRQLAGLAVKKAKKSGSLVQQACFVCGAAETHAHHSSYAEDMRLAVTWLCAKHHGQLHREADGFYVRIPGETMRIGLAEAKAKFCSLLDHVQDGHVIAITRRGKVVALLIGTPESVGARRAKLEAWPRLPFPVKAAELNAAFQARSEPEPGAGPSEPPLVPQKPQNRAGPASLTLADIIRASGTVP